VSGFSLSSSVAKENEKRKITQNYQEIFFYSLFIFILGGKNKHFLNEMNCILL
jgi:hypothetical protein